MKTLLLIISITLFSLPSEAYYCENGYWKAPSEVFCAECGDDPGMLGFEETYCHVLATKEIYGPVVDSGLSVTSLGRGECTMGEKNDLGFQNLSCIWNMQLVSYSYLEGLNISTGYDMPTNFSNPDARIINIDKVKAFIRVEIGAAYKRGYAAANKEWVDRGHQREDTP